jgi:hypothetical protein
MKRIAWTALALAVFTFVGCNVSFAHDGHDPAGAGRPGGFERERGHDDGHGRRDGGFGFGVDSRGFGFGFGRGGFGFCFERDHERGYGEPHHFAPRSWRW